VAVEAGGVLMLDRDETIRGADAHGCAIEGLASADIGQSDGAESAYGAGRVMGRVRPSARDRTDIAKGLAAVERLARFETGSAVVVARAYILAFAAAESASAMLARVRSLRQWGVRGKRRLGVLVCRAEEGTDASMLEVLCEQAARQGLSGIAVAGTPEALAPYEELPQHADAHGLFLVTCRPSSTR
jgi:DUF1009 family protein